MTDRIDSDEGNRLRCGPAATAAVRATASGSAPHVHDVRAVLYRRLRTGFSHDLGLLLQSTFTAKPNLQRSRFRFGGDNLGVIKEPTLSATRLQELDDVTRRPERRSIRSSSRPNSTSAAPIKCVIRLRRYSSPLGNRSPTSVRNSD